MSTHVLRPFTEAEYRIVVDRHLKGGKNEKMLITGYRVPDIQDE